MISSKFGFHQFLLLQMEKLFQFILSLKVLVLVLGEVQPRISYNDSSATRQALLIFLTLVSKTGF